MRRMPVRWRGLPGRRLRLRIRWDLPWTGAGDQPFDAGPRHLRERAQVGDVGLRLAPQPFAHGALGTSDGLGEVARATARLQYLPQARRKAARLLSFAPSGIHLRGFIIFVRTHRTKIQAPNQAVCPYPRACVGPDLAILRDLLPAT